MKHTQHLTHEQINAWIDGELTTTEATEVTEHVAACADCKAELESLQQTKAIFGMLRDVEMPRSFTLPASVATPIQPLSSPTSAPAARKQSRGLTRYEPVMRLMSIAAILAFLVVGGINLSGVTESDDAGDLNNSAQITETNDGSQASQGQEQPTLQRGEVAEQGDAAVEGAGNLNIFNANGDAPAQATDTGLTTLDITTAAVGVLALALIAGWILIHFRTGDASS